jgi:hypothetical protein
MHILPPAYGTDGRVRGLNPKALLEAAMSAKPLSIVALLLFASPLLADSDLSKELVKKMKDADPNVRLQAVMDAEEVPEASITSQLIALLGDKDGVVRSAAIEALRVRPVATERKKAAAALAARLKPLAKRLAEEEEYTQVISALHDLAEPVSIKALLDMDPEVEQDTARQRLFAVANVPSAEAIEGLIDFLARGINRRTGQRQFAAQALRYATGKQYGNDPDQWRSWWKDARATFDFEAAAEGRAQDAARKEEKARQQEEAKARREQREKDRAEKERQKPEGGGEKPPENPPEKPPEQPRDPGPPDGGDGK